MIELQNVTYRYPESTLPVLQDLSLTVEEGEFLLRRSNGNPFYDEILNNLVGKTIQCSGKRTDLTLIITHWEECSDQ